MKNRLLIKYFLVLNLSYCMSCETPIDCKSKHPPEIAFVGFDTMELKSVLVEKYRGGSNFDSLISYGYTSFTEFDGSIRSDTIYLHSLSGYEFGSDYKNSPYNNWHLKLIGGNELFISNIVFNVDKCDRHEYSNPCYCTIHDMVISAVNCTYKTGGSFIYIHK